MLTRDYLDRDLSTHLTDHDRDHPDLVSAVVICRAGSVSHVPYNTQDSTPPRATFEGPFLDNGESA